MLSMVSESVVAEKRADGGLPNKRSQGKVPKKIHKAEREKLKRDQLNDLFLEVARALEPARQNNGKACILGDATRILRELILQVESLRKENVALVSESRYVTVERNELKDETSALEAEVTRLHNELRERQSDPMEHNNIADPALSSQPSSTALPAAQPPIAPFFVFPFGHDLNTLPDAATFPSLPKPTSQVRKPHARYPTPSDSWPLQILSSHQLCDSGSCNSGNDSSERA